jgi:phosphoglycolate phosphatase-like HAD superfamily hydrolase
VGHLQISEETVALLDKLKGNGYELYLASNSHSSFVIPALTRLGLNEYFHEIITLDSGYEGKADMLKAIASVNGRSITDLTYIADTLTDVKLADSLVCDLIVLLQPSSWDYDKKVLLVNAASG